MPAAIAYYAGIMKRRTQYTLRGVPDRLDQCLRETAGRYGSSLNTVALQALSRGLGIEAEAPEYHDLDDLIGTWVQDDAFDKALLAMDQVDPGLWK